MNFPGIWRKVIFPSAESGRAVTVLSGSLRCRSVFSTRIRASERIPGRAALLRGPIVYALESIDNSVPLHRIRLKKGTSFTLGSAQGLPEGTPSISGEALISDDTDLLYFEGDLPLSSGRFTAIPSALWQNRGDSSMRIWIPEAD